MEGVGHKTLFITRVNFWNAIGTNSVSYEVTELGGNEIISCRFRHGRWMWLDGFCAAIDQSVSIVIFPWELVEHYTTDAQPNISKQAIHKKWINRFSRILKFEWQWRKLSAISS